LAGGRAVRFGGDKPRALVAGKPLLRHVIDALEPAVADLVVVSDRRDRFGDWNLREVVDGHLDRGPMAGLHAALVDARSGWIALAPCDVVGLQADWLVRLCAVAGQTTHRAVAFKGQRWEPLPALYHTDLLREVAERLLQNRGALRDLLDAHGAAVPLPEDWHRVVRVTEPRDLEAAERAASPAIRSLPVARLAGSQQEPAEDHVAAEEPLEIRLGFDAPQGRTAQSLSVTMRTPGDDLELALGFVYGEGIVRDPADVAAIRPCAGQTNAVRVELHTSVAVDLAKLQRHFYATSSCGVCGKASLDAVTATLAQEPVTGGAQVKPEVLHGLPATLRAAQATFERTGGLHAAGLFDVTGKLLLLREDVGRHNAVDKVVGAGLLQGLVPVRDGVLLLSGRAGFEVVQKAVAARVPVVAAVGAASSLAVELAERFGVTLVGFLRAGRAVVYTGAWRISNAPGPPAQDPHGGA
jgi:FdhD protein